MLFGSLVLGRESQDEMVRQRATHSIIRSALLNLASFVAVAGMDWKPSSSRANLVVWIEVDTFSVAVVHLVQGRAAGAASCIKIKGEAALDGLAQAPHCLPLNCEHTVFLSQGYHQYQAASEIVWAELDSLMRFPKDVGVLGRLQDHSCSSMTDMQTAFSTLSTGRRMKSGL